MIIPSTISKSSKEKGKRNPSRFCKQMNVNKIVRLAHGGIIFGPVRKSVRNGKKTSACLNKVLRKIMH